MDSLGQRRWSYSIPWTQTPSNISVYDRGALTLHALRVEVGDAAWFDIMRTFHERYRYGNAAIGDFIAVAEEISGQDLGDFFDAWLYEERMPAMPELG